jgi:hypothetical protein
MQEDKSVQPIWLKKLSQRVNMKIYPKPRVEIIIVWQMVL